MHEFLQQFFPSIEDFSEMKEILQKAIALFYFRSDSLSFGENPILKR